MGDRRRPIDCARNCWGELPVTSSALHLRAVIAIGLGDLERAIAGFSRAADLDLDNVALHSELAVALLRSKRFGEAVSVCQRALQRHSSAVELWFILGFAAGEAGVTELAQGAYRRAIELRPDHADAKANLARLMHEDGRTDEAIALYRSALVDQPNHLVALNNVAAMYLAQGQFDGIDIDAATDTEPRPERRRGYGKFGLCASRDSGVHGRGGAHSPGARDHRRHRVSPESGPRDTAAAGARATRSSSSVPASSGGSTLCSICALRSAIRSRRWRKRISSWRITGSMTGCCRRRRRASMRRRARVCDYVAPALGSRQNAVWQSSPRRIRLAAPPGPHDRQAISRPDRESRHQRVRGCGGYTARAWRFGTGLLRSQGRARWCRFRRRSRQAGR